MRIGVLYDQAGELPDEREEERISKNEGRLVADTVSDILSSEHEAFPVVASLDIGMKVKKADLDLIFNLCEGYRGDARGESWIASQLEMAGTPFTGSDSFSLALCLNKAKTKQVLISKGLPTPNYQVFHSTSQKLEPDLRWPLIVKPVREDASEGISSESVVHNRLELNRRVELITETYDQPAMVEEYIEGRELNVAILGNWPCLEVLPISEIVFDPSHEGVKIVDFKAKWVEGSGNYSGTRGVCPADLAKETREHIVEIAKQAFRVMGCRDYARVDIRLHDESPYILEVNPNPCINLDSGFVRSASVATYDHGALINRIVSLAVKRSSINVRGESLPGEILIRTDRIEGKRIERRDIPTLLEWFNDPEIGRKMDEPWKVYTEEDLIKAFLLDRTTGLDLIFSEKGSGNRIGYCSIHDKDEVSNSGTISYLIGEISQRGKGYGKEMVRAVVSHAFNTMGLNRLEATVLPANQHSVRVLISSGFRLVGTLRHTHMGLSGLEDELLLEMIASDLK